MPLNAKGGEAGPERTARDAARTRKAILDAAEALFAERGFDAASLADIGRQAGVSRGAPNYFFGSKVNLYRAVLERLIQAEHQAVEEGEAALAAARSPAGPSPIPDAIRAHMGFLTARPAFLQLLAREALKGGDDLRATDSYLAVLEAGLTLIRGELARGAIRPVNPEYLLLSILALCWFPFIHAGTLGAALGIDVQDLDELAAYTQHVIDLVLRGIQAGTGSGPDVQPP